MRNAGHLVQACFDVSVVLVKQESSVPNGCVRIPVLLHFSSLLLLFCLFSCEWNGKSNLSASFLIFLFFFLFQNGSFSPRSSQHQPESRFIMGDVNCSVLEEEES